MSGREILGPSRRRGNGAEGREGDMQFRAVGIGAMVATFVAAGAFGTSGGRTTTTNAGAGDPLSPAAGAAPPSTTKRQALKAYGRLPLAFAANAGQTDARVRYYAQGAGFSIFLTSKEAMLALRRPGRRTGIALALRFLGSNRNVAIGGERWGPGRVNYLLGNEPAKGRTGLPTYERVVYPHLL